MAKKKRKRQEASCKPYEDVLIRNQELGLLVEVLRMERDAAFKVLKRMLDADKYKEFMYTLDVAGVGSPASRQDKEEGTNMSPRLEQSLIEAYPVIFSRHKAAHGGDDVLRLGVGDGWYNILDTCCSQITRYLESQGGGSLHYVSAVVALKVEERIGSLRMYVVGGNDVTNAFIFFAEALSAKTCERCGSPGTWVSGPCGGTRCASCSSPVFEAGRVLQLDQEWDRNPQEAE